jgi:hypothetical protein
MPAMRQSERLECKKRNIHGRNRYIAISYGKLHITPRTDPPGPWTSKRFEIIIVKLGEALTKCPGYKPAIGSRNARTRSTAAILSG